MRREIYIITLHWTILFIEVYQLSMIWICQKFIFIQCIIRIMKNFFFIYAYIPLCINSPIHREIKQRSKYRHKRCPIQRIKNNFFFQKKCIIYIIHITAGKILQNYNLPQMFCETLVFFTTGLAILYIKKYCNVITSNIIL